MWIYSVYNSLEDSVSLLILIVVHRRSVLCWCWRDVFSHVLVSGYPSFPLAAAPRLSLLHLVYLCSHSGENTVHNLEDESDSHILSIFKAFYFPTFLPFCCSSYMMKRLFGKSDLETRCGYWFQLQSFMTMSTVFCRWEALTLILMYFVYILIMKWVKTRI